MLHWWLVSFLSLWFSQSFEHQYDYRRGKTHHALSACKHMNSDTLSAVITLFCLASVCCFKRKVFKPLNCGINIFQHQENLTELFHFTKAEEPSTVIAIENAPPHTHAHTHTHTHTHHTHTQAQKLLLRTSSSETCCTLRLAYEMLRRSFSSCFCPNVFPSLAPLLSLLTALERRALTSDLHSSFWVRGRHR